MPVIKHVLGKQIALIESLKGTEAPDFQALILTQFVIHRYCTKR